MCSPNIITPKHAEQDQIDAKWLEKSLLSDVRVEEQVEFHYCKKSIKETEKKKIFFSVRSNFISPMNTEMCMLKTKSNFTVFITENFYSYFDLIKINYLN